MNRHRVFLVTTATDYIYHFSSVALHHVSEEDYVNLHWFQ